MISTSSTVTPRISIIIPIYNAADFLAATLDSILQQSYPHFEIIAVDDGSQDGSGQILVDYAKADQRVRIITQTNQGVAAARNTGITKAQADLIAPIDADDLWHPEFLAHHLQLHTTTPQLGVSYCWSVNIDAQARWTGGFQASPLHGWVHNTMLCHYFLGNGSCSLIRRDLLEAIQGYRERFSDLGRVDLSAMGKAVCEDWDLYLRLAERTQFGVVPKFLVGYRKHATSASQKVPRMRYWHQQLLAERRQQLPRIRSWLYTLSQRSFEGYLQQQQTPQSTGQDFFPHQLKWRIPDRMRLQTKLWLTQLLHWLVQIGGQHYRSQIHPAHLATDTAPPTSIHR